MECEFAFLCDFVEQDRKIHALGIGWETIQAHSLPHRQAFMGIVARFRGSIAEAGQKHFSVRLIDADGRDVIAPIQKQVNFEPPGAEGFVNLAVQLSNVQFKEYGSYAAYVVLGGEQKAHLPFKVQESGGG